MRYDTKIIITIVLLVVLYPAGLMATFWWMKWPWWVKLLISLPAVYTVGAILLMYALVLINPTGR